MFRIITRAATAALLVGALAGAAAAQAPAPPAEPSFISGGIKVTVVSIAVSKDYSRATVALSIENRNDHNVLVAMLGPPAAVDNRGNSFGVREVGAVSGIATCGTQMGTYVVPGVVAATPEGSQACLEKVLTKPESYTLIDKHQSIVATINFALVTGDGRNAGNRFSFSSTIAARPESADGLAGKELARARLLSVGVALIPLGSE